MAAKKILTLEEAVKRDFGTVSKSKTIASLPADSPRVKSAKRRAKKNRKK